MKRIITFLLYTLPVIIFFSYHPIFTLGATDSTNYELSLPIIWLALFFCASIIYLPKAVRYFRWPRVVALLALPLYATISILWSPNQLRAFLTAALLALTFYAAAMIIYLLKSPDSPLRPVKNLTKNLIRTLLIATTVICAFCWLQCLLDVLGVSRDATLLCLGCTSEMFGFPHPNGFAIEPQFMGNLLLAPTLLALYLAAKTVKTRQNRQNSRILTLLALFFAATLFLTFSRGAIYAFALALVALLIYAPVQRFFSWRLLLIPLIAFCLTLCAQGAFAQISPTNDTFTSGITKVIHQLSLGKIDLRDSFKSSENPLPPSEGATYIPDGADGLVPAGDGSAGRPAYDVPTEEGGFEEDLKESHESVFSGYVEDSTNIRLNLTSSALSLWHSSPTSAIFGAGLGSAGTALYENAKTASPKEIIQNQYASLLLELGLIGTLLAGVLMFILLRHLCTTPVAALLVPLLIAYAATLFFFAGLPNALQIYLLPPLLYACLNSSQIPPNRKRDNSKSP